MSIIQAIILAIIEGITEFLPISSTGHMVLMSSFLGIEDDKFTKLFEVCIQLGAILAVVVLYWKKFFDFSKYQFYVKLLLAVIPALIFGKLFDDLIDERLGNPAFIATVMLIGGVILLFVDDWFVVRRVRPKTINHQLSTNYLARSMISTRRQRLEALSGRVS